METFFNFANSLGIHAYLLNRRIQIADTLLRENKIMVKEAADSVGFSDPLYFSRLYKQRLGYSPSKFIKIKITIMLDGGESLFVIS
jgi:AraC-like DNA-binding protein